MQDNWFENFKEAVKESKKQNETNYLVNKSMAVLTYPALKGVESWNDTTAYESARGNKDKVYYIVGMDGSIGYISSEEQGACWFLTPPSTKSEWMLVSNFLEDEIKCLKEQVRDQR